MRTLGPKPPLAPLAGADTPSGRPTLATGCRWEVGTTGRREAQRPREHREVPTRKPESADTRSRGWGGPRVLPHILLALLFTNCASAPRVERPPTSSGRVVHTIGEEIGHGVEPAHIYEIDSHPVMFQKRTFSLPAGEHQIRVWPVGPAQRMVPDLEAIERQEMEVDAITLRVEPGHRYFLGARRTRSREVVTVITPEGTESELGGWKITIEPVLVKVVQPPDLERVATGLGGFLSTFLIGPLLAGVL